jgi:lysozyme
MTTAKKIADALRPIAPDGKLLSDDVALIDKMAALWGGRKSSDGATLVENHKITVRTAAELAAHEALVREAYKDSVGVWTWAIGVTNASGHQVYPRYKDAPQSLDKCFEIYVWLLQEKYAPAVRKAFSGHKLTEAQFAAALSFHYNTGAILTADWVKLWKSGDIAKAKTSFMNWRKPAEIIPRREKERDLFFDGKWSGNGIVRVLSVRKPSYQPDFSSQETVNSLPILQRLLS